MAAPWKDPSSGVWHLRQRTPRDLFDRVRGTQVELPIGDGVSATVKLNDIVKVSLRTKDDRLAKQRHAVADASLRTLWARMRASMPAETASAAVPAQTGLAEQGGSDSAPRPGDMPWDEAVKRFSHGLPQVLENIGVLPTDANQGAVIAGVAGIYNEAFTRLRAKHGMAHPRRPGRETSGSEPRVHRIQPERQPLFAGAPVTVEDLWTRYRNYQADKLAANTLHRYSASIASFAAYLPSRDARSISGDDVYAWAVHRRDKENIQPRTINANDLVAVSSLFTWAMKRQGERVVETNPAKGITLDVPRRTSTREPLFRTREIEAILQAALAVAPSGPRDTVAQARRWCPWLAAYSGARISELTALEVADIREEEGVMIMHFSKTKNNIPRSVPIHEHLIEQGFLQFVSSIGSGPLFYNPSEHSRTARTPPYEIRSRKVADWVRHVTDLDMEVDPNHGWRHTFKTRALRLADARIRDAIVGHSPGAVSRKYEHPSISEMAEVIKIFPRYEIAAITRS